MTKYEAINTLLGIIPMDKNGYDAIEIAINAIRREIPISVINIDSNDWTGECSKCGSVVYNGYKYCIECGNALKDLNEPQNGMKWSQIFQKDSHGNIKSMGYECSNCGYLSIKEWDSCPHCTAKLINKRDGKDDANDPQGK